MPTFRDFITQFGVLITAATFRISADADQRVTYHHMDSHTASPTKNPSPPLLSLSSFSNFSSDLGSCSSRNFFFNSA